MITIIEYNTTYVSVYRAGTMDYQAGTIKDWIIVRIAPIAGYSRIQYERYSLVKETIIMHAVFARSGLCDI